MRWAEKGPLTTRQKETHENCLLPFIASMIAFITGSNFYEFPGFHEERISTRFGEAECLRGESGGREILVLPRHGPHHRNLPHHINHRANLLGLRTAGATAIVSCSVCGVLNGEWPLATPMIASDIFFPENRLPDGSPCTIFVEAGERGRGHLLAAQLSHEGLGRMIEETWRSSRYGVSCGTYAHVNGPRFNSKVEIQALSAAGVDFLSQTCGPEAVLANELELPFALAAFAVDYANGVKSEPTPVAALQENLKRANEAFTRLIGRLPQAAGELSFENFIYRFEP